MPLNQAYLVLVSALGLAITLLNAGDSQAANRHSFTHPLFKTSTIELALTEEADSIHKLKGDGHGGQGGQVIESGAYHLELVTEKEANSTHLDFYLQNGNNHQAIANAKVTGQVQMPDGTQKTLNFKYDAAGKHYTAILPGKVSGTYKLIVLSDINGKKVNGRFSFSR